VAIRKAVEEEIHAEIERKFLADQERANARAAGEGGDGMKRDDKQWNR
jgi:hypothetical protein